MERAMKARISVFIFKMGMKLVDGLLVEATELSLW